MTPERTERRQPAGILLVDSEVLARSHLFEYLRHCGYRLIEAATTDEAVTVLSEVSVEVQLVLSSTETLGDRNAFALASWIRREHPGIPVILAGNHQKAAEVAGELCDEGPDLARPYDPGIVLDRIRRSLAERARKGRASGE